MPRVKTGPTSRRRHKKILKRAKGFQQGRRRLFKRANEAVTKAMANAYRDRRNRKRDFRRLWVQRINAAARQHELSYSRFMHGLKLAGVAIDRKQLADIAGVSWLPNEGQKYFKSGKRPMHGVDDLKTRDFAIRFISLKVIFGVLTAVTLMMTLPFIVYKILSAFALI